jgi:PleD family two-component response regulator
MDGFEFLQTIRKYYDIPVVIVSARQDDSDMILGLGTGTDDYATKPFSSVFGIILGVIFIGSVLKSVNNLRTAIEKNNKRGL